MLGGSRGLGAAISRRAVQENIDVLVLSRKAPESLPGCQWQSFDFSKAEQLSVVVAALEEFAPDVLIYSAGGGAYGRYGDKQWKDHEWTWQVTFQSPAFLLWTWYRGVFLKSIEQWIVVGSAVAESKADPQAAMYCAAKHALRGLASSLQQEYPDKALYLFSAPYMDTDLLPSGSWPRQVPGLVQPVDKVADEILGSLKR